MGLCAGQKALETAAFRLFGVVTGTQGLEGMAAVCRYEGAAEAVMEEVHTIISRILYITYYVTVSYIMLCSVMLCYVTLCYNIALHCYIILCYGI